MDYKDLIDRMFANAKSGISCKDIALREGAYAITDLLARAEAAEARAEKAERERDAAISDMEALMWHSGDGCQVCAHAREVHRKPYIRLECSLREKGKVLDCIPKWRGIKEK